MHQLLVQADENSALLETSCKTLAEYKATLSHPIEIEAFGPQFFFSIMGQSTTISLTLSDNDDRIIESDQYELKLG